MSDALANQPAAPRRKSTVGRIALVFSVIGIVVSFAPWSVPSNWTSPETAFGGALVVGAVLLPIAFILGIVGLFRSGQPKAASIAAVLISIIASFVSAANVFVLAFANSPPPIF
jgi:hypothetical protein